MNFISLRNNSGNLGINGLNNGFITSNSGNIESVEKISETHLDSNLQSQISTIDTLSSDVANLQNEINNLGDGLSLDNTLITSSNFSSIPNTNFAKEWITCENSGTPNIIDICCSGDGRVAVVCPWVIGSPQISTDYGNTWFQPSGLSSMMWSCAASLDGKYIIASDSNTYKISTDYGSNFTVPNNRPFNLQTAALNGTGKYIVCACGNGNGLQASTDYGVTWVVRETSTWLWSSSCIALDGSIMYACSSNGLIKKSIDYGQNWTNIYTDINNDSFKSICCSNDGKYILVAYNSSKQLLLSSNYGSTFTSVGTTASYYKVCMSMSGVYMIASVNGSGLYYSTNSGNTWQFISNNKFCAIAMSYNADIIYNVSPYNKVLVNQVTNNIIKSSQPTIYSVGSNYFDSNTGKLYIYNGTAWKYVTLS
jgi:photosystem II stability/assembly factor-like uncharacterized protein